MTPPESASPQDLQHEISLLRRRIADLEQECQSHRTVEQALRRNEELTRRITQSMLGGLVQVGINGQIVYANNEAQRILGMSFDELSQRYVHDFAPVTIHEDGSPYAAEDYPVSRCLRTGQPQTPALIGLKMPDGEVIWALFSAAPLTDPDGKTIGAVVTFLDMTQLRKTQEALRASDEQYRRLIEGVRLIAWEFDPASKRFTFVSHQARDVLGYAIEDWYTPEFWYRHLHPEDRDRAAAFAREHAARGMDHEFEYRMVHADGREIWFKDITTVVTKDGKLARLRGVFIDLTQRKRAEEQLRKSEEKYRSLVEITDTGYVILDMHGHVLDANAEYIRLTGHKTLDEIRGRNVIEWTAPNDHARNEQEIRRIAHTGFVHNVEIDYIHASGATMPLEVNARVIDTDEGRVILALCRDISKRKMAQAALQRSAEVQRMMLSELDHRVRNNLASLGALIDISRQKETDVASFAASIRGRVQAMAAVHSLLSRARWLGVGLNSLIHSLTPDDLQDHVAVDGPNVLITSRQLTALGMIVQELMANSLKYGALMKPGGKVSIQWTVDEEAGSDERVLLLTWQESDGPPIPSPPQTGQGSQLILGFSRTELRGEVELTYPSDGACHRFKFRLDPIKDAQSGAQH